jgi:hypothetical protein
VIDCLHIDGDHSEEAVNLDIALWPHSYAPVAWSCWTMSRGTGPVRNIRHRAQDGAFVPHHRSA